jgi:peptidoglycan hydrolase CwlO-like protein
METQQFAILLGLVLMLLVMFGLLVVISMRFKSKYKSNFKEIKELKANNLILKKQILIKDATLKTCMENVEILKKENSIIKKRLQDSQDKIKAINKFIGEMKKS